LPYLEVNELVAKLKTKTKNQEEKMKKKNGKKGEV
jgi:hypothetical protein